MTGKVPCLPGVSVSRDQFFYLTSPRDAVCWFFMFLAQSNVTTHCCSVFCSFPGGKIKVIYIPHGFFFILFFSVTRIVRRKLENEGGYTCQLEER